MGGRGVGRWAVCMTLFISLDVWPYLKGILRGLDYVSICFLFDFKEVFS